jgi:hypothetical protein
MGAIDCIFTYAEKIIKAIRARSPTACSRVEPLGPYPRSNRSSGTLALTGFFFSVGGSSMRYPSRII